MSPLTDMTLLVVGRTDAVTPASIGSMRVLRVVQPQGFARAIERHAPSALAVDLGDVAAISWTLGLPPAQRPALIFFGSAAPADARAIAEADEYVASFADPSAELRMGLAISRAASRRRLHRRAFHDLLTGLPNRRAMVRGLVTEARRAERDGGTVGLVLIDLDDFKAVNERGGHPAGDRVLRQAGFALRSMTRAEEQCGRIGGDEFAIVVRGTQMAARSAAERAVGALKSVGISATAAACARERDESLRALYRRCDRGLAEAKRRKRSEDAPSDSPRRRSQPLHARAAAR